MAKTKSIVETLLKKSSIEYKENWGLRNLAYKINNNKGFKLESGSFDTLIKLSKEGLGMTLLPYLHTLDLNEKDKKLLREFTSPQPAREISLIYHKSQLKIQLIDALKNSIDGVIRGAISFNDVKIISPLQKK